MEKQEPKKHLYLKHDDKKVHCEVEFLPDSKDFKLHCDDKLTEKEIKAIDAGTEGKLIEVDESLTVEDDFQNENDLPPIEDDGRRNC